MIPILDCIDPSIPGRPSSAELGLVPCHCAHVWQITRRAGTTAMDCTPELVGRWASSLPHDGAPVMLLLEAGETEALDRRFFQDLAILPTLVRSRARTAAVRTARPGGRVYNYGESFDHSNETSGLVSWKQYNAFLAANGGRNISDALCFDLYHKSGMDAATRRGRIEACLPLPNIGQALIRRLRPPIGYVPKVVLISPLDETTGGELTTDQWSDQLAISRRLWIAGGDMLAVWLPFRRDARSVDIPWSEDWAWVRALRRFTGAMAR